MREGPLAIMLLLVSYSCSTERDRDGSTSDGGTRDASLDASRDASADAGHLTDGGFDASTEDGGGHLDPRGFLIRVPQERQIPEVDFSGQTQMVSRWDIDHVCTLVYQTTNGFLYVQARPIDCAMMGGCNYQVDGAWISENGQVTQANATYDYGGNHHNDWIEVSHDGKQFKLYHSSFGWGWRKCHPPDCLTVYDSPGGSLIEDGCTFERTVPIVCVRVQPDGGVPPLDDTFAPCPGDPNVDAG